MLELRKLCKSFPDKTVARDISLSVPDGTVLAVLGGSGSGKSSLLNMISGLAEPDSGDILLDGIRQNGRAPEQRQCAMMFQDFALLPHLNVWQNVAFGLRMRRVGRTAARRQAEAMLEEVGLAGMAERQTATLSGGEKQRVALARALVLSPKILLLDEPFSSLDTTLRRLLQQQTRALVLDRGIPALLVTHDPAEACLTADRIALLAGGRIIQYGRPAELVAHPASHQAAALLGCLNADPQRYIPPDAVSFGNGGTVCPVTALHRLPAGWQLTVQHPVWGSLTGFVGEGQAATLGGSVAVDVDERRVVRFQAA